MVLVDDRTEVNVWVEFVGADGVPHRREIAIVERIVDGVRLDDFGLSLEEGKAIQRRLQEELTQAQADQACWQDRKCHECHRLREIHDYRSRPVHSLFGICPLRVSRFSSCACGKTARSGIGSVETLLKGGATPELERIQAELGSCFRDDECRIRIDNAPENFVTLKHIAANLAKRRPDEAHGGKARSQIDIRPFTPCDALPGVCGQFLPSKRRSPAMAGPTSSTPIRVASSPASPSRRR